LPEHSERVDDLARYGPRIPLELSAPDIGSGILSPSTNLLQSIGLVDTGAQCTLVDGGLADELGLVPTGTLPIVATGGQQMEWPTVLVRLILPGDSIRELVAGAGPLLSHGFGCILGRDLLMDCTLTCVGPEESFRLSY
jgi:hypothetical protein